MNRLSLCARVLLSLRPVNYEGHRCSKRWVAATLKEINHRNKKISNKKVAKRSSFLDWNRDAEIYAFNCRLSEKFELPKLEQAFTHKSYIWEQEQKQKEVGITDPELNISHNEDLITRGMKLTSEVVMRYLVESLPRVPETGIMAFHDYVMSKEYLANASLHLGTKDIILTAEHPISNQTLADTFLALVGALADSVDANHASMFVRDFLIAGLVDKDLTEIWCPPEPLVELNNVLSQQKRAPFEPRIIAKAGTNTLLSVYQIAVYSDKQFLGSGFGENIDEAITVAATDALCRMYGIMTFDAPLRFDKAIEMTA